MTNQYDLDQLIDEADAYSNIDQSRTTASTLGSMANSGLRQESVSDTSDLDALIEEANAYSLKPLSVEQPQDRPGIFTQAGRDLKRGLLQTKGLAQGLGALAADVVGADETADNLLNDYLETTKRAEEYKPVIGSYKNIEDVGDAGRYAVEALMENIPMMLPSLVTGGIGGVIAKKGAQKLVKKMVEDQVAKGVERKAAEKIAAEALGKAVAKRVTIGGAAGSAPTSVGTESGSIYGETYQESGKKAPLKSIIGGTVAGALDVLPAMRAVKTALGASAKPITDHIVKRYGKEVAKQFFSEAPTEAMQTLIEQGVVKSETGEELFNRELVDNLIDSFLKGGVGGAAVGAGAQAIQDIGRKQDANRAEKQEIKQVESDAVQTVIDADKTLKNIPEEPIEEVPEPMPEEVDKKNEIDAVAGVIEQTIDPKTVQELQTKLTVLQAERDQLQQDVWTDPLTKMRNRRYAIDNKFMEERKTGKEEESEQVADRRTAMIDIDHFKSINDTHGHSTGDRVLRSLGSTLNKVFKDKAEVVRYGGEEIAIFPKNEVSDDEIAQLIDQARKELLTKPFSSAKLIDKNGEPSLVNPVNFSAGISDNMKLADDELYKAKEAGRGRTYIRGNEYGIQNEVRGTQTSEQRVPGVTGQNGLVRRSLPKTTAATAAKQPATATATAATTEVKLLKQEPPQKPPEELPAPPVVKPPAPTPPLGLSVKSKKEDSSKYSNQVIATHEAKLHEYNRVLDNLDKIRGSNPKSVLQYVEPEALVGIPNSEPERQRKALQKFFKIGAKRDEKMEADYSVSSRFGIDKLMQELGVETGTAVDEAVGFYKNKGYFFKPSLRKTAAEIRRLEQESVETEMAKRIADLEEENRRLRREKDEEQKDREEESPLDNLATDVPFSKGKLEQGDLFLQGKEAKKEAVKTEYAKVQREKTEKESAKDKGVKGVSLFDKNVQEEMRTEQLRLFSKGGTVGGLKAQKIQEAFDKIIKQYIPIMEGNINLVVGELGEGNEARTLLKKGLIEVNPRIRQERIVPVILHELIHATRTEKMLLADRDLGTALRKLWDEDANGEIRKSVERDYAKEYKDAAERYGEIQAHEDVYLGEWIARHMERHEQGRTKGREGALSARVFSKVREFIRKLIQRFSAFLGINPAKSVNQHMDEILSEVIKTLKKGQVRVDEDFAEGKEHEVAEQFSKGKTETKKEPPERAPYRKPELDPEKLRVVMEERAKKYQDEIPEEEHQRYLELRAAQEAHRPESLESIYADARASIGKEGKAHAKQIREAHAGKKRRAQWIKYFARGLDSRVEIISPKIREQFQKFIDGQRMDTAKYTKRVVPFLKKMESMSEEDLAVFDIAAKNADGKTTHTIANKYKADAEYKEYRKVMDEIVDRAQKAGIDVQYLKTYFPRIPRDREGFIANYVRKRKDWGQIQQLIVDKEKQLGRSLDESEKANLITRYVLGGNTGLPGTQSNMKSRTIEHIDTYLNALLMDTREAIPTYIDSITRAITTREFFGKKESYSSQMEIPFEGYENGTNMDETIGQYIKEQVDKGELKPEDQDELIGLIRSYMNYKGTDIVFASLRDVGYLTSMGSGFSSMFSQLADAYSAFYTAPRFATQEMFKAFLKKSKVKYGDLGFERVAEEFRDATKLAKILDKVFKVTGLSYTDTVFKNTFINANLRKYQSMAKDNSPALLRELDLIFGDEAADIMEELKQDYKDITEIPENIQLLLSNKLSKFQPVTRFQLPEAYQNSPKGRILYALKTYMIKQMGVILDEVHRGMRDATTPQEYIVAYARGLYLIGLMVAAQMSANEIKDVIFRRKTTSGQQVVDALLAIVGISRYVAWKIRTDGVFSALWNLVSPSVSYVEYVGKDVFSAIKTFNSDDPKEREKFKLKNLNTLRSLPIVGQEWWWWFGGGREKELIKREKERPYAEMRKEANKTKKEYSKLQGMERVEYTKKHPNEVSTMMKFESLKAKYKIDENEKEEEDGYGVISSIGSLEDQEKKALADGKKDEAKRYREQRYKLENNVIKYLGIK